jgi:isoleucyl-tRNA synthetase
MMQEVLEYWHKHDSFLESIRIRSPHMTKTFYDGPPFPSGDPHYGHLLQSTIKDLIPRWMTMRGYRVQRRWWWDCHGIPAENAVNKVLGITSKKQVEDEMGVGPYIDACRRMVATVNDNRQWYVDHLWRWVDMEHAYFTMDPAYMEAVISVFARLYHDNLIYKWFKVLGYSTALWTALSHSEIAEWYEERQDPAVTIAFALREESIRRLDTLGVLGDVHEGQISFLAWTTTPWTLPSNMFLAVHQDISYVIVQDLTHRDAPARYYILAHALLGKLWKNPDDVVVVATLLGSQLAWFQYLPLFPFYYHASSINPEFHKDVHRVVVADFVTDKDGTGIAHEAPAFGEDDYRLVASLLPKDRAQEWLFAPVDEYGQFTEDVPQWVWRHVLEASKDIITYLKQTWSCIKHETIVHSYPHCPRTWLPLIYRAIESWFLKEDALKAKTIPAADNLRFVPASIYQRFVNGLSSAPDRNISRTRYRWAPLPVWQNADQSCRLVVGTIDEIFVANKPFKQIVKLIFSVDGSLPPAPFLPQDVKDIKERIVLDDGMNEDGYLRLLDRLANTYAGEVVVVQWSAEALSGLQCLLYEVGDDKQSSYALTHDWPWSYAIAYMYAPRARYLDLHKPVIDEIILADPKTWEPLKRVAEVLDCWFESWSMPFAEHHRIGQTFVPYRRADVIAEWLDQTRWRFRALHVLATAVQWEATFDHVLATGLILAADGKKMSKSKKNYSDPAELLKQYGADAFRLYVLQSPVVRSEPLKFSDAWVEQTLKDVVIPLENVWNFLRTYAQVDEWTHPWTHVWLMRHGQLQHVDAWRYDASWKERCAMVAPDIVISSDLAEAQETARVVCACVHDTTWHTPEYHLMPEWWSMSYDAASAYRTLLERFSGKRILVITHTDCIQELWWSYVQSASSSSSTLDLEYGALCKIPLVPLHNELDTRILASVYETLARVTDALAQYHIDTATKALIPLLDDLSNWYVRRSRRRFWTEWKWTAIDPDKSAAYHTLFEVFELIVLMYAPFAPFLTESLWQDMYSVRPSSRPCSVHHQLWPVLSDAYIDHNLLEEIASVRKIIKTALYLRATHQIKVKQPLASLWFSLD